MTSINADTTSTKLSKDQKYKQFHSFLLNKTLTLYLLTNVSTDYFTFI